MTYLEMGLIFWAFCTLAVLAFTAVEIFKHGWAGYVEIQRIDQNVEYMAPRGIVFGIVVVAIFAPFVLPVIIIQLLLK